MLTVTDRVTTEYRVAALEDDLRTACRQIPPLWDLENYVAVNPFLGFSGQPIAAAAAALSAGLGAELLPDIGFYRRRWAEGGFGTAELNEAAGRAGLDPQLLAELLSGAAAPPTRTLPQMRTFAERYDARHGSDWEATVCAHAAHWCAAYLASDAPAWSAATDGLYAAWRAGAQTDRSLALRGLRGWRAWAGRLPQEPQAALIQMLERLNIASAERGNYVVRLLRGVFGWAAYLRREPWSAGDAELGPLLDLIAIRICLDAAVVDLAPGGSAALDIPSSTVAVEDPAIRLALQEALEDGYARTLLAQFNPPPLQSPRERPDVQAVFCIDVRSEVLRRHLEALSPGIETRGFAGFFAVFLEWETAAGPSARCPVLLQPGVTVRSQAAAQPWNSRSAVKKLTTAPAAAYTFVETLGLGYALGLAGDALNRISAPRVDEGAAPFTLAADGTQGLALAARIELALLMLKNMGLRDRYGRLVVLAGHEGRSENNAHQAGLDCGACGGHGGAINARIAAAVLNDPQVRAALSAQGYAVPADTHFVPAVHDTSSDDVRLLDVDQVPASHRVDLAQLRRWLTQAGAATRTERAVGLGMTDTPPSLLDRLFNRRARDWSEVRPEWALARNAAFLATRRERTRGQNLEGRAFLHEYDWTTDPDNSILTLILTAPLVVASWINLQYFASTVDNAMYGCGTKALHNRVGTLGVVLGNGGDLRTGLALQSVQSADGRWYHEPLRLQVVVEAPTERIDAVLAAHAGVRDLVEHGWVRLYALDADGITVQRRTAAGWRSTPITHPADVRRPVAPAE